MKKLFAFLVMSILCFTACFSVSAEEETAAELDGWILDFRTEEAFNSVLMSDYHNVSVSYDEASESMVIDFVNDYTDPQINIAFLESFPSAEYPYMKICAVNTTSERVWQFFPLTTANPFAMGSLVFSAESRTLYNQTLEDGFESDIWSLTTYQASQGRVEGWGDGMTITGMRFDVLNQPNGPGPVYVKYIAFFKNGRDADTFDGTQSLKSLTGSGSDIASEEPDNATPDAETPASSTPEVTPTVSPTVKPSPTAKPSATPIPTEEGSAGISTPVLVTIIIVAVLLIAAVVVVIIIVKKNKKK